MKIDIENTWSILRQSSIDMDSATFWRSLGLQSFRFFGLTDAELLGEALSLPPAKHSSVEDEKHAFISYWNRVQSSVVMPRENPVIDEFRPSR